MALRYRVLECVGGGPRDGVHYTLREEEQDVYVASLVSGWLHYYRVQHGEDGVASLRYVGLEVFIGSISRAEAAHDRPPLH